MNKYINEWQILVNYGQGWEYEIAETNYREAKKRIKEYRENAPQYPIKLKYARIINPLYPDKAIPKKLFNQIYRYFDNQIDWFYIRHPKLEYTSPITYIKQTNDVNTVFNLAIEDTDGY